MVAVSWLCLMELWQSGPKYAAMFAKAIQNITTEDPVQYLLTMIDQLLTGTVLLYQELISA